MVLNRHNIQDNLFDKKKLLKKLKNHNERTISIKNYYIVTPEQVVKTVYHMNATMSVVVVVVVGDPSGRG